MQSDGNDDGASLCGWHTARHAPFPAHITLELDAPATLRQLRVLSHEYKIASAAHVYVTRRLDARTGAFSVKKLGTLRFETNVECGFRARELKTVHVNASDVVEVKLEFIGCHENVKNDGKQIGLMALTLIGEPSVREDACHRGALVAERAPLLGQRLDARATTSSAGVDAVTEEKIREITARKEHAVANEDYDEAKRLRDVISKLIAFGAKVRVLQEEKMRAVDAEDYDEAKRLKIEIDKMRAKGYEDAFESSPSPRTATTLAPAPTPMAVTQAKPPVAFAFDDVPIRSKHADAMASGKENVADDEDDDQLVDAFETKAAVASKVVRPTPMNLSAVVAGDVVNVVANNDEIPAVATGKRVVPPELEAEAAALFAEDAEQVTKGNRGKSSKQGSSFDDDATTSGGDDASDLPAPEPLSPSERVVVAPLVAVFGEDVVGKLYSSTWLHRENALQTMTKELIGFWETDDVDALGAQPRETFHTLCSTLGVRCFNDKVANVTCAAAITLAAAAKAYSGVVSSKDVRDAVGESMSTLADKLGDSNPRLRESVREALHAFVADAPGGCGVLATALCKPVQKLNAWRVLTGRLTMLLELVPTHGLDAPAKENSFSLEHVMKFATSCFESANGEARSRAMQVVLACVDIVGGKVRKYLPKTLKPAMRDVVENAIEESEDSYDVRDRGGALSPKAATSTSMSMRGGFGATSSSAQRALRASPTAFASSPRRSQSTQIDGGHEDVDDGADAGVPSLTSSAKSLEREITRRIDAYGEQHPDVAAAMNDLATVHSENEDFDRALTLYERALAIQRAALGDAHPETVQTLTDLAICHLDRDENDLGKPLLERALEYQEAILGPNHADVGAIRDVLASLDGGVR